MTNQPNRRSNLKTTAAWIETHRFTILRTIDNCLIVFALLAVSALIARIGFHLDPSLERIAQLIPKLSKSANVSTSSSPRKSAR
jgi:hypothetical protein